MEKEYFIELRIVFFSFTELNIIIVGEKYKIEILLHEYISQKLKRKKNR